MVMRKFYSFLICAAVLFAPVIACAQNIICVGTLASATIYRKDSNPGSFTLSYTVTVTPSPNIGVTGSSAFGTYRCDETVANNQGYYFTTIQCSPVTAPNCNGAQVTMTFEPYPQSPGLQNGNPAAGACTQNTGGGGGSMSWNIGLNRAYNLCYTNVTVQVPANCQPGGTYSTSCTVGILRVNSTPAVGTIGPINFSFSVVPFLTVTEIVDFHFGAVGPPHGGGTSHVVMTHGGSRSGTAHLHPSPRAATGATVNVSGTPLWSFSVSLPHSITLTEPGGQTVTVSNFTTSHGLTGLATDSTGNFNFHVGGRLDLHANPALNMYTGALPVTINY